MNMLYLFERYKMQGQKLGEITIDYWFDECFQQQKLFVSRGKGIKVSIYSIEDNHSGLRIIAGHSPEVIVEPITSREHKRLINNGIIDLDVFPGYDVFLSWNQLREIYQESLKTAETELDILNFNYANESEESSEDNSKEHFDFWLERSQAGENSNVNESSEIVVDRAMFESFNEQPQSPRSKLLNDIAAKLSKNIIEPLSQDQISLLFPHRKEWFDKFSAASRDVKISMIDEIIRDEKLKEEPNEDAIESFEKIIGLL